MRLSNSSEFSSWGFNRHFFVLNKRTIADNVPRSKRCGIYILHFTNGEYYVGLATNVVRRFSQHRKNHTDIEYVSFKTTSKKKLPETEKETVHWLESLKKPLRNIAIVSNVIGETDLDEVVSPDEYHAWLNYNKLLVDQHELRFDNPDQRRKYARRFLQLKALPIFDKVAFALREYVTKALPFPKKTEYSFWSLSCLPGNSGGSLARLNINWQETLVVFQDWDTRLNSNEIFVSIWLTQKVFTHDLNPNDLRKEFVSLEFEKYDHAAGGEDQMRLIIHVSEFQKLLQNPHILKAAREFNYRLMRKGPCAWSRYHCYDLSDVAMGLPTS